jgi:hypothetical protein
MKRKRTVLLVLVCMLIASATWGIINYPRSETVSRLKYASGHGAVADKKRHVATRASGKVIDSGTLRLDLLEKPVPKLAGYRNDMFQPIFEDKETMMARKAAEAAAKAAAEAQRLRQAVKPPPLPSRMQREMATFVIKGFVVKDGRKTVFLNKGDEVHVLKQGDAFAGKYVATSVTDQMLKITVKDTGDEILIPLTGSRD